MANYSLRNTVIQFVSTGNDTVIRDYPMQLLSAHCPKTCGLISVGGVVTHPTADTPSAVLETFDLTRLLNIRAVVTSAKTNKTVLACLLFRLDGRALVILCGFQYIIDACHTCAGGQAQVWAKKSTMCREFFKKSGMVQKPRKLD